MAMPADKRPRFYLFGESLGSQVSEEMFRGQGTTGPEGIGLEAALWIGTPASTVFRTELWGTRTVAQAPDVGPGAFYLPRAIRDWKALPKDRIADVRFLLLQNGDDPVPKFAAPVAWKRPDWLGPTDSRPPGSPLHTRWLPVVSFVTTFIDLQNALVPTPGIFQQGGHDYREEIPEAVRTTFRLDIERREDGASADGPARAGTRLGGATALGEGRGGTHPQAGRGRDQGRGRRVEVDGPAGLARRGRAHHRHQSVMAPGPESRQGERRLPMALAVLAAGVLYLFVPADFRVSEATHYGYPALLVVFLVVLIIGDPGRIDRESRWLRVVTGLLIVTITLASAASAVRLVVGILQQADFTSPGQLLTIGAVVWITNIIAFALWYWHLDGGGPAARINGHVRTRSAFRFPEEDLAELSEAGWYPQFVDYFALSFNTSTAFSPTDVSAVRHWSKLMMILESAISLVLVVLVVARAVNVL